MTIIIAGINYPLYPANFKRAIIYNYGLLLFNDLNLRRFPNWVSVDEVGKGWIFLFFIISFILAIISMIFYLHEQIENIKENKIFGSRIILSVALTTVVIYAIFFLNL
jgi:hypothetical protein